MAGNGRFQCRGGGNEDTRAIREEQGNANTVNPTKNRVLRSGSLGLTPAIGHATFWAKQRQ